MRPDRSLPSSAVRAIFFAFVCAILAGCFRNLEKTAVTVPDAPGRAEIEVVSPRDASAEALPLIVVLHGYGASPFQQEMYFNLGAWVSEKRFRLVALAGTEDRDGKRFWNASAACCDLHGSAENDVAYVARAIAAVRAHRPVSKVFLAGHSNGGFMAFRLACDLGEKIDGVFSLAGADEPRECAPGVRRDFRVVLAHGTADEVISDRGGSFRGLPRHASADETRALWETRLGCAPGAAAASERANYSWGIFGDESDVRRRTCGEANRLVSIRIDGGSHIPWINSRFRADVLDALLGD